MRLTARAANRDLEREVSHEIAIEFALAVFEDGTCFAAATRCDQCAGPLVVCGWPDAKYAAGLGCGWRGDDCPVIGE
jgi:hypothetical protein